LQEAVLLVEMVHLVQELGEYDHLFLLLVEEVL
jgi:hypothetical protein